MNLQQYKEALKDKQAAVIGIGVSNLPLIHFLRENGAKVTACDRKEKWELGGLADRLIEQGVLLQCGEDYLEHLDFEVIFKTPGMRPDVPQLVRAAQKGIEITSEMELFFQLCPCQIFAVTGSDGKTTTTTLIYTILKTAGYHCHLGGNIGRPLIGDLEKINPEDMAVVELSSFQLFSMASSPEVAVVTNVAPNHLDWHSDMAEYVQAKKNIFKYQTQNDRLVLNYDNELAREMQSEAKGDCIFFSRGEDISQGIKLRGGTMVMELGGKTTPIIETDEILLPGEHNIENYMAAAAAVWGYAKPEHIRKVAKEFGGVEHRIEFVRELRGVKYYNDSIASSPTRTAAALNSFRQKIILIAGGYDKKIPFDGLGGLIQEKVKHLVLVGDTAEKIKRAVEQAGNQTKISVMEDFCGAVNKAVSLAKAGDIVVLSPACASFDLFKNFEERGNLFKKLVGALK